MAAVTEDPALSRQLVNSCFGLKLAQFGVVSLDSTHIKDVINIINRWRLNVGATRDVTDLQIRTEAVHLINTFPELTYQGLNNDIDTMIDLLVKGRLDVKLDYINFSPLFIGRVVSAYKAFKTAEITKMRDAVLTKNPDTPPTPVETRLEGMKWMIETQAEAARSGHADTGFSRDVYDFLRKTKRMQFTDAMIQEAKHYSDKKYPEWLNRQPREEAARLTAQKALRDQRLRQFGIEYCLVEFFKATDLPGLLAGITVAEYEKYLNPEKK